MWLLLWSAGNGVAGTVHTFFSRTQYPLTVYHLKGQEPGPTVLVQGGIQGDEPSGFLTAQILARSTVRKGTLIVIPRANVPSIQKRTRQINVDLNRRFDRDYGEFYEDRLARAIRVLLKECDAFIHLHEGSGFYSPTYVDQLRNPFRYGQSVIIDTPVYEDRIHLARLANTVLSQINGQIVPADYHFQLFNTDTFSEQTKYPEQRKSLTYYALNQLGIPALAIELSKSITELSWKVRQQLMVTHLFLAAFGVDIDLPTDFEPESCYTPASVEVAINDRRVDFDTPVHLALQDVIRFSVEPTEAMAMWNPAWGVYSPDRPQTNLLTGASFATAPMNDLTLVADGNDLGTIRVDWDRVPPAAVGGARDSLLCLVNDRPRLLDPGSELHLVEGDRMVLETIWGSRETEILNLKGYVSNHQNNDGQDAGHEIIMEKSVFMAKYLLPGQGTRDWRCEVVRETPGRPEHRFFISVSPRRVEAVVLKGAQEPGRLVLPVTAAAGRGSVQELPAGIWSIGELWSNGPRDLVQLMQGDVPLAWEEGFSLSAGEQLTIELYDANTFALLGALHLKGS